MSTFSEQLSGIKLERLSTVLRLNLKLSDETDAYAQVRALLRTWIRDKAEKRGVVFADTGIESFDSSLCRLDAVGGREASAFVLEEKRAASGDPRDWLTEVAVTLGHGGGALSL